MTGFFFRLRGSFFFLVRSADELEEEEESESESESSESSSSLAEEVFLDLVDVDDDESLFL